jgi:hypothetical protein
MMGRRRRRRWRSLRRVWCVVDVRVLLLDDTLLY